jgi:HK97 family phage prohead protease
MEKYDFSGWATRVNLKCSDGRTIMKDAFKHNDGKQVPLVWNHQHNDPNEVLGHALLENREEGVYAYCKFNDTESGKTAKLLVEHGDVNALSIYANQLKQNMSNVTHGNIREVSLVLAGANPGAFIDAIMMHGEESDEEAIIYTDEFISLSHADEEEIVEEVEEVEEDSNLTHSDEEKKEEPKMAEKKEKTVGDVFNEFTDEQKNVVYAMIGQAIADAEAGNTNKEEDEDMKHNVFEQDTADQGTFLSHSAEKEIITMAKASNVGSLQTAINMYMEDNDTLKHGFVDEDGNDAIDTLFPEYKLVKPGAPELVERDQSWVASVMSGVHKSPISRIRTRFADARSTELRAKGYQKKGDEKKLSGNIKLVNRTTDPQTVYRKDTMHRDDIIDITDFDVVEYQYKVMRHNLEEELATAIMIGDSREEGDPDKISEEHIRSIWHDDELYTIHVDVDIEAARKELQGSDTSKHFGENYIYAEAIITAALYSREKYKGKGNLEFYCTPHLLNVMLLARDLNGRRIYDSKADLASALNVKAIHTVEQFEDKTRTTKDGKTKKLLGLFVNLSDYHVGSTKGGEITRFSDFDIDFNTYKYLIETRLSGAMVNLWSAIALEEPVGAAG